MTAARDEDGARSNFQRSAGEQGRMFDQQSRWILRGLGFDAPDKCLIVPELGVEVDCAATNRHGHTIWFEFKGSWLGSRPGSQRTDTMKKALLTAYSSRAVGGYPPVVVLTSHRPKAGFRSDRMLAVALETHALLDLICVNDIEDMARLERLANLLDV